MKDFILFMYNDATNPLAANDGEKWGEYLAGLRTSGQFEGGSSIGTGLHVRKGHPDRPSTPELNGFIRIRAEGLERARNFLAGNPIYEAGGTVEIRELPPDE
ncbi:MAG: hypothetical protein Q8K82_00790 [Gemmatimonadaceae bacterium]|nr:hypothetical protein [Gemmatimonadaceae bacterium]